MLSYTKNQILNRIDTLGYKMQYFMLVGVRSKADIPNEFDDVMYLITPKIFVPFLCTTNPGTDWLLEFLNPNGAAVLKPGEYLYKLGIHKGYKALVQALPVTVYRDTNRDLKSDESGTEQTGFFGINIHRASQWKITKYIGKYSAGCQVLANPSDFEYLIKECEESKRTTFPYILLKEF